MIKTLKNSDLVVGQWARSRGGGGRGLSSLDVLLLQGRGEGLTNARPARSTTMLLSEGRNESKWFVHLIRKI